MFFLILAVFILIDYLIHTCIDTISMELSILRGYYLNFLSDAFLSQTVAFILANSAYIT